MSTPQSIDTEERPNNEDKSIENGDGATNTSSSGAESPTNTPSSPIKEAAAPPTHSQPVPFVYDPNKITLKFIFANRDGVYVIVDFKPSDTVGEVKGALLSMWPDDLPACSGGDKIRLICMGKGMLSPDTKTLQTFDVPVFKTHATPVNVAVRPENIDLCGKKGSPKKNHPGASGGGGINADRAGAGGSAPGSSGCSCVIL
mmetsp:Transcript_4890/g.11161  ORF Transcript_4890/g.11161 Transcript_4890/m.11161 type:complete len:201 (+) Transcript_4890:242-844(+)|eukprot:CAMPEP_0172310956 /NCGR_PEP_ID=MMETSP1058-20130122/13415_1 /TAXON_ID=83371 /ORGANISM="Detonula confervacea, Strain CCMP 353" /LENGTH=200 /DNA_ID=CAMNT_0013023985 /DNA_START=236 /DNA_END=838 /DNA_ORIENTATION=-